MGTRRDSIGSLPGARSSLGSVGRNDQTSARRKRRPASARLLRFGATSARPPRTRALPRPGPPLVQARSSGVAHLGREEERVEITLWLAVFGVGFWRSLAAHEAGHVVVGLRHGWEVA